jgi:hypothetical protein
MVLARWCLLLLVLTGMPAGSLARAQNFGQDLNRDVRLEWSVTEGRKEPAIAGYLNNLRDGYVASHVRLQVEALDGSGHVIGARAAYVSGDVPPGDRVYFEVPVPVKGAAGYRVTVRALDWRGCGAGAGGA